MINKKVIECPYCMSRNVGVISENSTGDMGECYCSNCNRSFGLGITYEEKDGELVEVHTYDPDGFTDVQFKKVETKCNCEECGRSSESYEEEINRLKYDKEQLLLSIENLNKTIGILMNQIIREGYRSK